ncbi:hypothetical protein Taro_053456 [Colocasia esculenta]|uniref:Glycine cleavage system H protein n=1 Tax=Colocasia esculenta TaxID=4460 RepID=A0A843XM78_COLES|nr:hypothetical protein [Colocasia esculenta]
MAARALWASRAAAYLRISTFRRSFSSGDKMNEMKHEEGNDGAPLKELKLKPLDGVLENLKYADSHEWVKVDGTSATVGITDHAQDHLGDVVYVELPEVGSKVTKGNSFGAVESVKATSDVYSPVTGKIVEVNEKLSDSPGLVNGSPYESGWIMKVEMSDPAEVNSLLDSERYTKFCEEEDAKH